MATDRNELAGLINEARTFGATVTWNDEQVQISNAKGIGPFPMSWIAAAERLREWNHSQRTLQVLNAVQRKLIEFANENGINLADEFANVDQFKKFIIGLCIKTLVDGGACVQDAYNAVMGHGAYERLAAQTWEALQPKVKTQKEFF